MDFSQSSQNGVQPPSQGKTLSSNMGLAVSNTSTYYGRDIILKAISNAAMYKTVPVSFYSDFTAAGSVETNTILLGTNIFETTSMSPLVLNNLGTGTHSLYVTWPGENKFAPISTSEKPITVTVNAGSQVGGGITLYVNPASESVVTGEGNINLVVVINTIIPITGSIVFYDGQTVLGSAQIINNTAQLTIDSAVLSGGTHTLTASWNGGNINGTEYEGIASSVAYIVLRGTTAPGTLVLSSPADHAIFSEDAFTLTTALSDTSTQYSGTITFYNQDTQAVLGSGVVSNNQVTIPVANTFAVGTYTFVSSWDGNQSSHPRYIEKTSNALTFTIAAKETISSMVLTMSPADSYYTEPMSFNAKLTAPSQVPGIVTFIDTMNSSVLGTQTIDANNSATITISTLEVGLHKIQAIYAGNNTAPKFYPINSNTINTTTSAGYPLPFVLAINSSTYLDPIPGYYINEPFDIVLTNNTSTPVVNGTTATFALDDPFISNKDYFICSTSGTTSTIQSAATLTNITIGSSAYLDPLNNNLLGIVIAHSGNDLILDREVNVPTVPVWFVGPDYLQLGSGIFVGQTATVATSLAYTATVVAISDWLGNQIHEDHYYLEEVQYSNPITTGLRPLPEISITDTGTRYVGEPLVISLSSTLSNYYNLSDFDTAYKDNGSTTATNTITTTVVYFNTGTHNYAVNYGKTGFVRNITDPNRTYYFNSTGTTNSLTEVFTFRPLPILTISDTGTFYVGEPLTLTLTNTSTYDVSTFDVSYLDNGSLLASNTFTTSTIYYSSGTHTYKSIYGKTGYVNDLYTTSTYYFGTTTTSNLITATLVDRYLGAPITLSETGDPDYQGEALNIVLYTTSTEDLSGTTATIYINGIASTQTTFVGDVATADVIVDATGTFILSGLWNGQRVPSGKWFHNQATTTASQVITWHTLNTQPTLIANSSTYSTTTNIKLTFNLNTSTNLGGTFTFPVYYSNLQISTATQSNSIAVGTIVNLTYDQYDYSDGNNQVSGWININPPYSNPSALIGRTFTVTSTSTVCTFTGIQSEGTWDTVYTEYTITPNILISGTGTAIVTLTDIIEEGYRIDVTEPEGIYTTSSHTITTSTNSITLQVSTSTNYFGNKTTNTVTTITTTIDELISEKTTILSPAYTTTYHTATMVPINVYDPSVAFYISADKIIPYTIFTKNGKYYQIMGRQEYNISTGYAYFGAPHTRSTIQQVNMAPGETFVFPTSGVVTIHDAQGAKVLLNSTTIITTETNIQTNISYIPNVIYTATIVNNTATFNFTTGTISTGNYSVFGNWSGTRSVPYYFPATSTTATFTILQATAPITSLTLSTTTYTLYNQDNTPNTASIVSNISLTGSIATHAPTGIVYLNDITTGFTLTNTLVEQSSTISTATISWNPYDQGERPGTQNLTVSYLSDNWNSGTSISQSLNIIKPTPSLTIAVTASNNYYVGTDVTYKVTKPTGTTLTSPITFNDVTQSIVLGDGNFIGNTATIIVTPASTFTNDLIQGVYPETTYHYSTSTSTRVTVTKEIPGLALNSTATTFYYADDINLYVPITATRSIPGIISFKNNSTGAVLSTATITSNTASTTFNNLNASTITFIAAFAGDSVYAASTSNLKIVTILPRNDKISLSLTSQVNSYGSMIVKGQAITATLVSSSSKLKTNAININQINVNGIATQPLTWPPIQTGYYTATNTTTTLINNISTATLNSTILSSSSIYTITFTSPGDSNYNAITSSTYLVVLPSKIPTTPWVEMYSGGLRVDPIYMRENDELLVKVKMKGNKFVLGGGSNTNWDPTPSLHLTYTIYSSAYLQDYLNNAANSGSYTDSWYSNILGNAGYALLNYPPTSPDQLSFIQPTGTYTIRDKATNAVIKTVSITTQTGSYNPVTDLANPEYAAPADYTQTINITNEIKTYKNQGKRQLVIEYSGDQYFAASSSDLTWSTYHNYYQNVIYVY